MPRTKARSGVLERLLRPIAEVRPGEGVGVVLLAANLLLLLAAYYMLKTVRESLILAEGSAAVKAYSSAGQALLLLALVPAFGALASRVGRMPLIWGVTLFFVADIAAFTIAGRAGLPIAVPYFLWVGIFNVMVIAQFWAFVSDVYTPEQGKRLFPVVGIGSSLGAWLGSLLAGDAIQAAGPYPLLVVAAVLLMVCLVLATLVDRLAVRQASTGDVPTATQPLERVGGFTLIGRERYLMLIALMTVCINIVNTSGEYLFGRYIAEAAVRLHGAGAEALEARQRFVGGVYGTLFGYVNLFGFVLQLVAVSRILKYLGIARALLVHPSVALIGYVAMLVSPSVWTMAWLKVFDNSIDYSLGNTARQALWLPTSREAKYKAKQAVDSFFVRAGDVLQAGLVFVGERLAFTVTAFAGINIVIALGWLAVVAMLTPAYRAAILKACPPAAPVPPAPATPIHPEPFRSHLPVRPGTAPQ